MPTPEIGDYIYGGVVFYVDTTNEHVLLEGPGEVDFKNFNTSSGAAGISTSEALNSGQANTTAIIQHTSSDDAPQIISDFITPNTGHDDWFIASLGEMQQLYNSGVSRTAFSSNKFYGTSSIVGPRFKAIRGSNGATVTIALTSNQGVFRYIRKQSYKPPVISVENISGKELRALNDTLHFGFISYAENISHKQEILIRGRGQFSRIICFNIDMTSLADGQEATPQSLFGQLPNIISVRNNNNKIWYANSSSGVSNLPSIVNGVAYQLTFSDTTIETLTITGDLIRNITITVPQGESWFPMILGEKTEIQQIFNREILSKIENIYDLTDGKYYPRGGLKDLEIGRGYIIYSNVSFTHKFVLR
jgi:hypothetical protein